MLRALIFSKLGPRIKTHCGASSSYVAAHPPRFLGCERRLESIHYGYECRELCLKIWCLRNPKKQRKSAMTNGLGYLNLIMFPWTLESSSFRPLATKLGTF